MKFGKKLRFLSVFPWIAHYIDYKRLKRLVKATAAEAKRDRHGVAARKYAEAFEHAVVEELERVNDFFVATCEEQGDLARTLAERISDYILSATSNTEGLAALEAALNASARSLARLQEFVDVNLQGFRKAAKKFDKKTRMQRYHQIMLGLLPRFDFATSTEVSEAMTVVEASRMELLAFRETLEVRQLPRVPSTSLEERLKLAIRQSNAKRAEYLLRSTTPPKEVVSACGAALVHLLCSAGATAAVLRLIDAGVDIEAPDVCERTPLQAAVYYGQRDTVAALIERGAALEPRLRNFSGSSVLHFAVQGASADVMELLISSLRESGRLAGALRARDDDGFSALYHASISDKTECLRLLVNAVQDLGSPEAATGTAAASDASFLGHSFDGVYVWTCLNAAAYRGRTEALKVLLEAGADTSQRVAASASTALHSAARGGHADCVAALVDAGADVTALNAYAETPMHLACQVAEAECLKIMIAKAPAWSLQAQVPNPVPSALARDVPSDESDADGAAARVDGDRERVDSPAATYAYLPRVKSSSWVPLLHQAVLTEDEACVSVLLKAGSDPHIEDEDGWSAYALALFIGHNHHIAPMLLEAAPGGTAGSAAGNKSGDTATTSSDGRTPSPTAASQSPARAAAAMLPPTSPSTGDIDDAESNVQAGHEALGRGQYELRLALGGLPALESQPRIPALMLSDYDVGERLETNRVKLVITRVSDGGIISTEPTMEPSRRSSSRGAGSGRTASGPPPSVSSSRSTRDPPVLRPVPVSHLSRLPPEKSTEASTAYRATGTAAARLGVNRGLPPPAPAPRGPGLTGSLGSHDSVSTLTNQYTFVLALAQAGSARVSGASGFRSVTAASAGGSATPVGGASGGAGGSDGSEGGAQSGSVSTDDDVFLNKRWCSVVPGVDEEADEVMVFRGTSVKDFAFFVDVYPQVGGMLGRAFIPRHVLGGSLDGQIRVPVVSAAMLPVGMLAVRYTVVKYWEPPSEITIKRQPRPYWTTTKVWGHRGSGSDTSSAPVGPVGASFRRSHVTENTLLSFVTAASLGAEYVEFDVQLASDGVPVIHHDYLVKLPGGLKVPLTHVSSTQLRKISGAANDHGRVDADSEEGTRKLRSRRSLGQLTRSTSARRAIAAMGLDTGRHDELHAVQQRATGKLSDSFTTLEEIFEHVPVSCGFNIEVKYPHSRDILSQRLTVASRNELVDRTLDVVFAHAGSRSIMFSSFDPDIIVLLNRKQGVFPVFYLTEAGEERTSDPRRNSLRTAVRFAKSIGCLGVVANAPPLCKAPRLIHEVHRAGLLLCTYAKENNNADMVRLQREHGVSVVIVDHVAHISKALREVEEPVKPDEAAATAGDV